MKHAGKLKTVDNAIAAEAPTLGIITKHKGREFTEAFMEGWLMYLNQILNLKTPMTEQQIQLCAVEVLNEFRFFKISDLTLLFRRIISGQYGEFYESLSIQKILSYFREYYAERLDAAETMSDRVHNDSKSHEAFNYSNNLRRIMNEGAKRSGK